jgi:hypothetical protein
MCGGIFLRSPENGGKQVNAEEIRNAKIDTDLPKYAENVPLAMVACAMQQALLLREIAAQLADLNEAFRGSRHGMLAVEIRPES